MQDYVGDTTVTFNDDPDKASAKSRRTDKAVQQIKEKALPPPDDEHRDEPPEKRRKRIARERARSAQEEVLKCASSADAKALAQTLFSLKPCPMNFHWVAKELRAVFGEDVTEEGWRIFDAYTEGNTEEIILPEDEPAYCWGATAVPANPKTALEAAAAIATTRKTFGFVIDWPHRQRASDQPVKDSQLNIRAFLSAIGVTLYKDEFAGRYMIEGFAPFTELNDEALRALRVLADACGLPVKKDFFDPVVLEGARQTGRHPVRDYLAGAQQRWEQTPKDANRPTLDNWLIKLAGAEDTPLNRAFGRKWLIAAVRRVRKPGSKFDNALVLVGAQYAGKSTLGLALAGETWFSESLTLGLDAKETIENTSGVWIAETSELKGITERSIEAVKAFLSRRYDRAALKWDKFSTMVPRQFVVLGTTNEEHFLPDPTGNRRFWTVNVGTIDIKGLSERRELLWGEAAHYEATGETTELPLELWDEARKEQESRRTFSPYYETFRDALAPYLDGSRGLAVSTETAYAIAGLPFDQRAKRKDRDGQLVGRALRELNFVPRQERIPGTDVRTRVYQRAGTDGQFTTIVWTEHRDTGKGEAKLSRPIGGNQDDNPVVEFHPRSVRA